MISKAGCKGNNGKIGYSVQGLVAKVSEGYSSKWLIWLVFREPLTCTMHDISIITYTHYNNYGMQVECLFTVGIVTIDNEGVLGRA